MSFSRARYSEYLAADLFEIRRVDRADQGERSFAIGSEDNGAAFLFRPYAGRLLQIGGMADKNGIFPVPWLMGEHLLYFVRSVACILFGHGQAVRERADNFFVGLWESQSRRLSCAAVWTREHVIQLDPARAHRDPDPDCLRSPLLGQRSLS